MLFMLDWLESAELRRRCDAGLNKSKQRHSLVQIICTFKQGRIADRGIEAQQFRASGSPRSSSGIPPILLMPWPTCVR
jgi:TnpA family transposase